MKASVTSTNLKTFSIHTSNYGSTEDLPIFIKERMGRMYRGLMSFTRGGVHYFVSQYKDVDELLSRL